MSTPAGWYDDGRGQTRYWDGTAWTEHVAPAAAPPQPAVPDAAPAGQVAQEEVAHEDVAREDTVPPASAPATPAPAPAQAATGPVPQPSPAPQPTPPSAAQNPYATPSQPGYAPATPQPGYPNAAPQPGYPNATPQPGYPNAAPQPGYPPAGQPGYPPAPRSRKGLWIGLIVGGGAVVLVGIIVAVLVIVGIVRGATNGPEQALNAYNTAWVDGDCATMESVTTENWKDSWGYTCSDLQDNATDPPQSWHMTVTSSSVSGDEADLDYTLSGVNSDGDSFVTSYTAVLIQQNGKWLIDEDTYLG